MCVKAGAFRVHQTTAKAQFRILPIGTGSVAAALVFFGTVSASSSADSMDSDFVSVSKVDDTYRVRASFVVDACLDQVWAMFTDYEHLQRLSPNISESILIGRDNGKAVVRTTLHECFLFFCKDLVMLEEIEETQPGQLKARILPGDGDLSGGWTHWTFLSSGDQTVVTYESQQNFGRWTLPLLGARLIQTHVERNLRATVANVERLAAAAAGSNQPSDARADCGSRAETHSSS